MCEWQVKLCDPLVTHEPYLSTLEIGYYKEYYIFTFFTLLLHLLSEPSPFITVNYPWCACVMVRASVPGSHAAVVRSCNNVGQVVYTGAMLRCSMVLVDGR